MRISKQGNWWVLDGFPKNVKIPGWEYIKGFKGPGAWRTDKDVLARKLIRRAGMNKEPIPQSLKDVASEYWVKSSTVNILYKTIGALVCANRKDLAKIVSNEIMKDINKFGNPYIRNGGVPFSNKSLKTVLPKEIMEQLHPSEVQKIKDDRKNLLSKKDYYVPLQEKPKMRRE